MIKLHLVGSDAPILLDATQNIFFPTEDNGTVVCDTIEDLKNYLSTEFDEMVIYVKESVEEIEALCKRN